MFPPTTERTFAMADLAGSSRLWNRFPDRMAAALAHHDDLARQAVDGRGEIFKHTGDGFIAVFDEAEEAVRALATYQRMLAERGPTDPVELRSRACVHRGTAESRDGDWFGPAVNHLARMTSLVAPTHVVVSDAVASSIDDVLVPLEPLGAYSVRDVPEPVSLFEVRLPSSVGPSLTIAAGRGVPRFHSPLVGRDDDVKGLLDLLERVHLVSVVGFGGTGKTRVAVEVGRAWAEHHGAPAHLVDLTSAGDPLVAVADAVGVPSGLLSPDVDPGAAIGHHLGAQPVLLVIDNCEHVIAEVADAVIDLLELVPQVRLLATSREPLEVDGEAVFALAPLSTDAALDLFLSCVEASGAGVVPRDDALRLCAQVDYLPLGIELIAARLRHLDPGRLSVALADNLGELRSRRRDRRSVERHSTMRALVAWSFDLLAPDEQVLLLRLARLPAPWPPETARALAPHLPEFVLGELISKSLVARAQGGQLRILEPVRQYCAERLAGDLDAAEAADDALIEWARAVTSSSSTHDDPEFDPDSARLLAEQAPNVRAALAVARQRSRTEDEAEIALGLWPLLVDGRARSWLGVELDEIIVRAESPAQRRDLVLMALHDLMTTPADAERESWLVVLLAELDPEGTSAASAVARMNAALKQLVVDRILGLDPTPTRTTLDELASGAGESGRRLHEGLARLYQAFSHLLQREFAEAVTAAERSASILRSVNFVAIVALADATAALALGLHGDGELEEAVTIADAAVSLAENAPWETSVSAAHLFLLVQAGRLDEARPATATLIERTLSHDDPAVRFDAAIGLAAMRAGARGCGAAWAALEHAGIGRTPLTIFLLFELASGCDFDLGTQRFVDALDMAATRRRGEQVIPGLREALDELAG